MLEVQGLTYRYRKGAPMVLKGVDLQLKEGEIGIVLGKNGTGKTTLFKTILGIQKPLSGRVLFEGSDLLKMSRKERAARVAYVPQDIRFGELTVYDSILMGRISYFNMKASGEDVRVVERVMADMGLTEYADRNVEALSGGERQKIAIARAMAQEPRLMIFDEPTGNLDIANEQLIIEEARKLARERNIAILSSLHDLNQALSFGDRFFLMKDGIVKYSCSGEEITEDIIFDIFGIHVRIIDVDHQKIIIGGGKK